MAAELGGALGQGMAAEGEGCSCRRSMLRSIMGVLQGKVDEISSKVKGGD